MSSLQPSRFSIRHDSFFDYDEKTRGCIMLARLRPREDRGQRLMSFSISTEPDATPIACDDSFANNCHIFSIYREFTAAQVRSSSVVHTPEGPDLRDRPSQASWDDLQRQTRQVRLWNFLTPSKFVRPSNALDAFVKRHGLERGPDPLATLREVCSVLNARLVYAPGSTTVESPIDCILQTGEGVCQDYTHVMLALGRRWGIPGRYVSGYLYLEGETGQQSREVESHAWAEFWLPELGWVGFDPTNDSVADHRYVRIAQGRDYSDAAPTRGVVFGGGSATVRVSVQMELLEEDNGHDAASGTGDDQIRMTALPWQGIDAQSHPETVSDQ